MSNGVVDLELRDGVAFVFSDLHRWPGVVSTAERAVVEMAKWMQPQALIANGDMLDGSRISRHPRIGWQKTPKLSDELDAVEEALTKIHNAAPDAKCFWPLGNHDARFETYLANHAPEFAGVHGFSLREHFPLWQPCWQVRVNGDTIIQHRWKGGKNATLRNVIESGANIFTGHLHSAKTSPYTDVRGTRFGVDSGTMADPHGPQFADYTECSPLDWRSGFVIATFVDGKLLWPEHVHVVGEGKVSFRGKVMEI